MITFDQSSAFSGGFRPIECNLAVKFGSFGEISSYRVNNVKRTLWYNAYFDRCAHCLCIQWNILLRACKYPVIKTVMFSIEYIYRTRAAVRILTRPPLLQGARPGLLGSSSLWGSSGNLGQLDWLKWIGWTSANSSRATSDLVKFVKTKKLLQKKDR